jgi:hypothetical protein
MTQSQVGALHRRYPNQILDPVVRAYIYRWPDNPAKAKQDYSASCLTCAMTDWDVLRA